MYNQPARRWLARQQARPQQGLTRIRPNGNRQPHSLTSIQKQAGQLRQDLLNSIDYEALTIRPPILLTQHEVMADALTYLELLTLGHLDTRNARHMGDGFVSNALKGMVPRPYYVQAGMPNSVRTQYTFGADQTFIMKAATLYINDLRECRVEKTRLTPISTEEKMVKARPGRPEGDVLEDGKELMDTGTRKEWNRAAPAAPLAEKGFGVGKKNVTQDGETTATLSGPLTFRASRPGSAQEATPAAKAITESERLTERALMKIQQWCDLWLDGTLKDDEWKAFEHCLSIPDR